MQTLIGFDGQLLLWIQEHMRCGCLTPVMKLITHLADAGLIWIGIALLLLMVKSTRKTGMMCAVSLILTLLSVNLILKNACMRTRPYEVIEGLRLLIKAQTDYSFPSGHTAASFSVACVMLWKLPKKYGIPAMLLAVLIGFSRLYVGVHYPTDVLGGMAVGIITAFLGCRLVDILCQKRTE